VKWKKVIKEMSDKKATVYDDTPVDVLQILGEGCFRIVTQLINNKYDTAQWPKDFTAVTMIAIKEAKGYKTQRPSHNQPHCTYSKDSSEDTETKE
jgi:hypothetical protein